jgi:hypothetical protein
MASERNNLPRSEVAVTIRLLVLVEACRDGRGSFEYPKRLHPNWRI